MAKSTISLSKTRFAGIGVRTYRNGTCVGVPGRKPFKDSWTRFVDLSDDAEIGPIYKTRAEAFGDLERFAAERGFTNLTAALRAA